MKRTFEENQTILEKNMRQNTMSSPKACGKTRLRSWVVHSYIRTRCALSIGFVNLISTISFMPISRAHKFLEIFGRALDNASHRMLCYRRWCTVDSWLNNSGSALIALHHSGIASAVSRVSSGCRVSSGIHAAWLVVVISRPFAEPAEFYSDILLEKTKDIGDRHVPRIGSRQI